MTTNNSPDSRRYSQAIDKILTAAATNPSQPIFLVVRDQLLDVYPATQITNADYIALMLIPNQPATEAILAQLQTLAVALKVARDRGLLP